MTPISSSTHRRLLQLPQIPSVWEGDRRQIDRRVEDVIDIDNDGHKELIVWVDGVEGVVRSMEVVSSTMGAEAIVRTLIKAMDSPQSPAQPARPQKIIVRDRQLQFYLRGVLQELDIAIDYVPELPIVDELFHRFSEMASNRPPKLPPKYLEALRSISREIWNLAPWEIMADREIISIEINNWDVDKFYVSIMGMLGMEYGILFYRSAESLTRFRAMALNEDRGDGKQDLEEAFLSQDCIFITFDAISAHPDRDLSELPALAVEPNFGNIHPMEGMRPFLYEEEAMAAHVALTALNQFVKAHRRQLKAEEMPALSKQYKLELPDATGTIKVNVATCPELSQELLQMHLDVEGEDDDFDPDRVPLREDLVPDDSYISLGAMPWDVLELTRCYPGLLHHQESKVKLNSGDGLPLIVIQTTRPKAKEIVDRITSAGGLSGICFNTGEDPLSEYTYDLGILQLADGEMQMFGEFDNDSQVHVSARKKWDDRVKKTKGFCGLLVTQGLTGKSRGKPGMRETVALFEARSISEEELGLGLLQLISHFE